MVRLVVADMDGTLLNKELKISEANKQAIRYLNEQGILFTFATGRPDQLMKEYVDEMGIELPVIMCNGSIVGHPFRDERILEKTLSDAEVRIIVNYCEANDILYMIYTKDRILSKPNYRSAFFRERNKSLPDRQKATFEDFSDPYPLLDELVVNKVLLIERDDEKNVRYKNELAALLPDVRIIMSQKAFIDINPENTSKGHALALLAKHLGIAMSEIVAFGDQDNDIEMLQEAGIGVAMGNAKEHVQAVADEVTLSNDEDGFAIWINDHL